jgi:hypothetical protein
MLVFLTAVLSVQSAAGGHSALVARSSAFDTLSRQAESVLDADTVDAEQLKLGNFVEKMQSVIPPGKYALESAVMDWESGKTGPQSSGFVVPIPATAIPLGLYEVLPIAKAGETTAVTRTQMRIEANTP